LQAIPAHPEIQTLLSLAATLVNDSNPSLDRTEIPADWPERQFSRIVACDGLRWHLQESGSGPLLLLIHGTGGSTHSWAPCLPALRERYTVLAIDLPGHGFTDVPAALEQSRDVYSLHGMAHAVDRLLQQLGARPTLVAAHSAGVSLLMQLALRGAITPSRIVGFNPALIAPPTLYTMLLGPLVGALVERTVVAETGAWLARGTKVIELMLASSGTSLTAEQLARYRTLCARPGHIHAALTMMSRWDLPRLLRDAHALRTPLQLIAGTRDHWVPVRPLARVVERLANTTFREIDAGHLIPEERPDEVVRALVTN
jgi:magnesium chelatase accessory protein